MRQNYKLLLLCALMVKGIGTQDDATCKSTNSIFHGVEWPESVGPTLSKPPCVNEAKEFLFRECIDGVWGPEPNCFYVQPETLPQCPEGFIDAVNICYLFTEKTAFPPKCPFENLARFDSYKDIISLNGNPIWMPVRRDLSNGLGFLEWIEASPLYKSEFDRPFYVLDGVKGKDCLIYYNSSYIVLVRCDDEYAGVCAYYKLDEMSDQFCDDSSDLCRQSDFYANSSCFCVGGTDQNQFDYVKAEFLKPYQNQVYLELTREDCTIGLEKTNNKYIWTNSHQEIDYTFWSTNTIFDDDHIYGASTPEGWTLTQNPLDCFLYQKEVNIPEASLNLTIEETDSELHLLLQITNPDGLKEINSRLVLFCFTNAGSLSLTYRYDSMTKIDDGTYQFEPHKYGPGDYWCESFTYTNSEPIKSQVLFVNQTQRFGDEFIAILKSPYIKGTNPLSVGIIDFLERIFFIKLRLSNKTDFEYTSRLMKIIGIDEVNYEALVNVHFTCLLSPQQGTSAELSSSADEQFDLMRSLVNETVNELGEIRIEMIDFLSATYCPAEISQGLQWPRTEKGQLAASVEYCFREDGIRLMRLCDGDFISGARWSLIQYCTIPDFSTVTEELLKTLDHQNPLDSLYDISLRYGEFYSFDVYLVALICYRHWDELNATVFAQILDNVLKIDESVLLDAEEKTRAMDLIFDTIDNVASLGDIISNNFVTVSGTSDLSGLVLQEDGTVNKLTGVYTFTKLTDTYQNLQGAIWLSSDLISNIEGEKVIFKFFYNNAFFADSIVSQRSFRNIFGVVLPRRSVGSVQIINKMTSYNNTQEDCVYWTHDIDSSEGRGSWKKGSTIQDCTPFLFCSFTDRSFAVTVISHSASTTQNVTENLQQLLQSNSSAADIINKLSAISDRYDEFSADDVYLTSKILKRVSDDPEIDLAALAHIVSNLHKINRDILSTSQKKKTATDVILHSVDTIIKNHNYTSPVNVTDDKFMILISDLKETNFSGLVLFDNSEKLQTESLTGEVQVDDVLQYDNINSAVVLTSGLKQQLVNDSKAVVTIFSSDGLFNEETTKFKFVSKIFGVILPDLVNYSEPLLVIHKVSAEDCKQSCAYWFYNKEQNITGLWKKDNAGKNVSAFIQCEFWHTTHFALLLLDSDKYNSDVLDWITTITCALSMFGLCCIVLTAVFFKRWRTNSGNQILLNFVFAIILQICVFYTSSTINRDSNDYLLCTIIGVLLHYSIVSQFCWMFIIAVLQFKRFVEVLTGPPKHVLLKACLCGWVLPCLPVACVYLLDNDNYVSGNVGLCYPSDLGLYLGVWLPVCIIVLINLVIFVYIMYSVVHRKTESADVGSGEGMFQWRLAVLLFFMLGITWTFGFLSELNFGQVFVYAFCVMATLQGFIMFLFFIVFNANTRYLYTRALKKCCKNEHY